MNLLRFFSEFFTEFLQDSCRCPFLASELLTANFQEFLSEYFFFFSLNLSESFSRESSCMSFRDSFRCYFLDFSRSSSQVLLTAYPLRFRFSLDFSQKIPSGVAPRMSLIHFHYLSWTSFLQLSWDVFWRSFMTVLLVCLHPLTFQRFFLTIVSRISCSDPPAIF